MNFLSVVLEFIWFAAGIFCVIGGIRQLNIGETKTGIVFLILSVISFLMFYIRHLRRISKNKK